MKKLMAFLKDEEGSNAAEYGLLVALIAIVLVVGAAALGVAVNDKLQNAADTVTAAPTP